MASSPPEQPNFRDLILQGVAENSVPTLVQGLSLIPENLARNPSRLHSLHCRALREATENGCADALSHLLESLPVSVAEVPPEAIVTCESPAVWQVLLDHGWDINQSVGIAVSEGVTLLQMNVASPDRVRWLLEHGAHVPQELPQNCHNPCILDSAARAGSIETFELLRERGAKLGWRTLHLAAEAVKMGMVRHLVEERGLEVNSMDHPPGQAPGNHYGTPLNYASQAAGSEGVRETVKFLLDKGADPYLMDVHKQRDAWGWARLRDNDTVLHMLDEWEDGQNKG